ncbi:MAG TPA: SRPBCC family protein [Flavisolibacter sp.]
MDPSNLVAEASVTIHAPASAVWRALTTPSLIKRYLFGTDTTCDWKEGSPITYEGEYQGQRYRDKGVIKKIRPNEVLQSTYWSSMSGKEDRPENYNTVTYSLTEEGDNTILTIEQDNIDSEASLKHSEENWNMVLSKLKEVVESENRT